MANIRDVARRAGVAPSTVSYAFSGKRPISAEAQRRIALAVEELNFTPSALGRQLAHSRSMMIGLVYPVIPEALAWETLDFLPAVAAALNLRGYGLSLFTAPIGPKQILDLYRANTVDGFIVMQVTHQDQRIEALRATDCPLVLVGRCEDTAELTWVDYDPQQATYLIFEYLVQNGHRHIGYLDLPKRQHKEKLGYARFVHQGYEQACRDFDMVVTREETNGSIDDGFVTTERLLARDPRISAVVTVQGSSPYGALRALQRHGRQVPGDCSIIGIGRENWSLVMNPQMTSADVPLSDMVRTASELVLQQLAGNRETKQILFPASITVRESSGPGPFLGATPTQLARARPELPRPAR